MFLPFPAVQLPLHRGHVTAHPVLREIERELDVLKIPVVHLPQVTCILICRFIADIALCKTQHRPAYGSLTPSERQLTRHRNSSLCHALFCNATALPLNTALEIVSLDAGCGSAVAVCSGTYNSSSHSVVLGACRELAGHSVQVVLIFTC